MSGGSDGILGQIMSGGNVAGVQKLNSGLPQEEKKKKKGFFSKKKKKETSVIGTPYAVQQLGHVGFDKATGQFVGLPDEWKVMLGTSGITADEVEQNPDAVLQALEFQTNFIKSDGHVPPAIPNSVRRLQVGGGQAAPAPPRTHSPLDTLFAHELIPIDLVGWNRTPYEPYAFDSAGASSKFALSTTSLAF